MNAETWVAIAAVIGVLLAVKDTKYPVKATKVSAPRPSVFELFKEVSQ